MTGLGAEATLLVGMFASRIRHHGLQAKLGAEITLVRHLRLLFGDRKGDLSSSIAAIFRSILLALCFCGGASAHAQGSTSTLKLPNGGQILVTAMNADRDFSKGTLTLSGNVKIIFNQQYLSCDRAIINEKAEEIEAVGNFVLSSPQSYVEGDHAILNYRNDTGLISNGFVKSGQVIFEGRLVRKLGPDSYEAESARFTACTTCPPAWSFSGSRIRAEIGGYAYIKNSVFEIAKVPVLWLPYLIVPLKSERQTGLLIPSIDYTETGGLAVSLPYFWAISRSQDATFTLRSYAKRGAKGLVNYRYMLSESSFGELNFGYIRDRAFQKDPLFQSIPIGSKANRYFISYEHSYDLPFDFTQKVNLNLISDLRYLRDFPNEIKGYGDPALENRFSLTRNTDDFHSSLEVDYYVNLLKNDPTDTDNDAVHRWPEIRLARVERPVLGTDLLFNFNINYVNFARENFAFDDVEVGSDGTKTIDLSRASSATRSGVFNPETDLIRTGQRLDIQPELSYPIRAGRFFELLPVAQFRHTQYSFNVTTPAGTNFDPSPSRQYLRGQVSLRTRAYSIYGEENEPSQPLVVPEPSPLGANAPTLPPPVAHNDLYRHEIEPEVSIAGVPYLEQSDSAFFGSVAQLPVFLDNQPATGNDFQSGRGIQFDYQDRIAFRNAATFSVNNRLIRKRWVGGRSAYKQIASLRLGQSYDFDEAKRTPSYPWSDISALMDVRWENFETNTLVRYFPYHNVTNTSARARVIDNSGAFFQLSFNQAFQITDVIEDVFENRADNVGMTAGFDSRYLTFAGTIDYRPESYYPADFRVKSWSSYLNIKPPGDCWGIRATIRQEIGNELYWKLDFDYKFGG